MVHGTYSTGSSLGHQPRKRHGWRSAVDTSALSLCPVHLCQGSWVPHADDRVGRPLERLLTEMVNHAIPLDQSQMNLVTAVLHRAARDSHGTAEPEVRRVRGDEITLRRLAIRWSGIAEREGRSSVVDVDGVRLYMVGLPLEGWHQVRVALRGHAADLTRASQSVRGNGNNRERARRALLLADHIKGVTGGR